MTWDVGLAGVDEELLLGCLLPLLPLFLLRLALGRRRRRVHDDARPSS